MILLKKKILFWIDADLTSFCLAFYLKKKIDAEFYAIIDITNRPREFFLNQKLVNFERIWFYHDCLNKDEIINFQKIEELEKKYNLNLNQLTKNDRILSSKYNIFYKFTKTEIESILNKEFTLFEEILSMKPDFFVTNETTQRHQHTLQQLCKDKKIKVLMLNNSHWGDYCYISEDYHQLDNFKEIFTSKKTTQCTFEELQKKLDEKILSKKLSFYHKNVRGSTMKYITAAMKVILNSNYNNIKTHYTYFGRTRIKVFFQHLQNLTRDPYRQRYIDKNFTHKIPKDKSIIFFPLQMEPERTLLIFAPEFTDQMKTIKEISNNLPDKYLLIVKEHPTQGPARGWRKISDYEQFKNDPKVMFIHPSVSSSEIMKNSKLVISVSGTSSFEAPFFNIPSLTFSKNDFTLIPSVVKFNSGDDLGAVIQKTLKKSIEPEMVAKYIEIIEENSFIFNLLYFQLDYQTEFYLNGNLVDVEIDESKMKHFLEKHQKTLSDVVKAIEEKL